VNPVQREPVGPAYMPVNTTHSIARLIAAFSIAVLAVPGDAPASATAGAVSGTVTSSATMAPLTGAYVVLEGTDLGAVTEPDGSFRIDGIPTGAYVVTAHSIGYRTVTVTDVIVGSGRTTPLYFGLEVSPVDGGAIRVTPDYFSSSDRSGGSNGATGLSGEEVRRAPGSAGDVSRVISALPCMSRVDDQFNGLAVRGGNPTENGFYIDGIQVPNINHFPRQGSSGGGLGMVNVDLIREVTFSAGVASPAFGDRLSSTTEITLRNGAHDGFRGQVDFGMAGFGTVLEGPLGARGSWIAGARRSWVDLLVDISDIDALPTYSDFVLKGVYDASVEHRISLLAFGALDDVDYDIESATEDGNPDYGGTGSTCFVAGLGWRWLWSDQGFTESSLSFRSTTFDGDYRSTTTDEPRAAQDSRESALGLRSSSRWQPRDGLGFRFGTDVSFAFDRFHNTYASDTSYSGGYLPPLEVSCSADFLRTGVFAETILSPAGWIGCSMGLRFDTDGLTETRTLSPRGSLTLKPFDGTEVGLSAGVCRQVLPAELLSRQDDPGILEVPAFTQIVLSYRQLLAADTRLAVEAYRKTGSGFAYDPSQPGFFVLDGVSSEQELYAWGPLVSGSETGSSGIELTLQKRLVNGLYGLVAASVSRSRYRNPGEAWRSRIFDNGWTLTLEGGYRFDGGWEVSSRWLAAGGRPYTPLDLEASGELNRTVLDTTRINAVRYPPYHSLNLRVDRRIDFSGSTLVCYASVWNVYNRRNVTATFWNSHLQREDHVLQWAVMPVVGLEYEF
jgi:hypothetical protein